MTTIRTTAAEAIAAHVRPGDRVLLGTGAGEATVLESALVDDRERLTPLAVFSGLQFGALPFIPVVDEGRWTYETWHVMAGLRPLVDAGRARLHLVRGPHVPRLIAALRPDVFLTAVSPPGPDGTHSFGASVSYALPMAEQVPVVIAEVNPNMPWVRGDTTLPPERFTALVDVDEALPAYLSAAGDSVSDRIAAHIHAILPPQPTVQIGIGAVPEGLVRLLDRDTPDGLTLWGMGIDAMVPLLERMGRPDGFVGGELLGTELLYRYAHDRPTLSNRRMAAISDLAATSRIPRFTSVVGALQIDLSGQVNSEVIGGRVISGPGGGFDFVDGSWASEGGISVVALRSTAKAGSVSTIVGQLEPGAPVTIPRHSVRYVATEHGIVDLFGLTLAERADALIALADPAFHDDLLHAHPARRG